jgi:cell fate (sporulation/competence/biofilm development) regulator YlbF (YheA/YmcA/DUF963 family)
LRRYLRTGKSKGKTVTHNQLEIATPTMVRQAAQRFAQALMDSPQYKDFNSASDRLDKDPIAQQAIQAFQAKQRDMQTKAQLSSVTPDDQVELEQLHQALMAQPAVSAYFEALDGFTRLCQSAADGIYEYTHLNIASACGGGCCG